MIGQCSVTNLDLATEVGATSPTVYEVLSCMDIKSRRDGALLTDLYSITIDILCCVIDIEASFHWLIFCTKRALHS